MDYNKEHLKRLKVYERQVKAIYEEFIQKAALMGVSVPNFNPDRPFFFKDYPQLKKRIGALTDWLYQNVYGVIVNGVESEWTLANNKNNELANVVFADNINKLPKLIERRYYKNNHRARNSFLNMKRNGFKISDRVWQYTGQYKEEIEMGLDLGLRKGTSAADLSREMRSYLNNPHKLFRRVRDQHGNLHLSKRAKAYHPGRGVYRSSYKNAIRLTGDVINNSYRMSDHERVQDLDFVVGTKIELSNNHTLNGVPFKDICDDLQGDYPKGFVFRGWHTKCRCKKKAILKTWDEIQFDNELILRGKEPLPESVNKVKETPSQFNDWVRENRNKIKTANSLPYFIQDNKKNIKKILRSKPGLSSLKAKPFKMTSSSVDWMNKNGFTMDIVNKRSFVKTYNKSPLAGFNIKEFDKELMKIASDNGIDISTKYVELLIPNKAYFSYRGNGFKLTRTFRIDNGVKAVHHDYFEIAKHLQGKGLSKSTFKSLYKQYLNAGVKKIDVYANIDIGGYTWAKYGFQAHKNDALDLISYSYNSNKITANQFDYADKLVNRYFDKNKNAKLFPMDLLANKKYGKKILLGSNWNGYLDLTDKVQRKVFEEYLGWK